MDHSIRLPSGIASRILTIGPDYNDHRGGIGAVIEIYNKYFEEFKFIPSYRAGNPLLRLYIFIISIFRVCSKLITDKKIRIVHIHGASFGSFYRKYLIFIIVKFIFRKKVIYHIHGGGFKEFYEKSYFFSRYLIRNFIEKSDSVICLSVSWFEFYRQNFKTKNLVILSNIINYPFKAARNSADTRITFLFLGLIGKDKGIFDLLNVIGKNKDKYDSRIKLLIGGNGEVKRLNNLIIKYQLGETVEFMGWVSKEAKVSAFNNSDIYILPSYNEGMPVSILEAMSYGLAIISSNVGGIPEIVKNKVNGVLIEPGNLEQIERSIDFFIDNPSFVKEYGTISEKLVQKYLPDSVFGQLQEIYRNVLNNNNG